MRILDWLARGTARFDDKALSRVRRGVKDTAAASASADSALGHALAWLGSELRGEAVPERLRDAAGRLASFLDPQTDGGARSAQGARDAPPVVALEDALAARERDKAVAPSSDARPSLPVDSAHARDLAVGVCPFTGLRADGTLAVPVADAAPLSVPAVEAREPPASETSKRASETSKRAGPRANETKRRQKRKERLAGAQTVDNTSGRSATRPAHKQPRNRVQPSGKKA